MKQIDIPISKNQALQILNFYLVAITITYTVSVANDTIHFILLITGEGNQVCYPTKYKIKLINIMHNIIPMII